MIDLVGDPAGVLKAARDRVWPFRLIAHHLVPLLEQRINFPNWQESPLTKFRHAQCGSTMRLMGHQELVRR